MTPDEKASAHKIARVMRAARKRNGLTQQELARKLGISQGALSKLEGAKLVPSAVLWFEFCAINRIPTDSLALGYLESSEPCVLIERLEETLFKVPKKYRQYLGSKARATLPFLNYLLNSLGEREFAQYFREIGLDPDYFVDLGNSISLEFMLDLARFLVERGTLKLGDLSKLTRTVTQPEAHGRLHEDYARAAGPMDLVRKRIENMQFYECNFLYGIEGALERQWTVSIAPASHLQYLGYRNDPLLDDFLCRYQKAYFKRFLQYGSRGTNVQIDELECHYKGAPKCIYRFTVA